MTTTQVENRRVHSETAQERFRLADTFDETGILFGAESKPGGSIQLQLRHPLVPTYTPTLEFLPNPRDNKREGLLIRLRSLEAALVKDNREMRRPVIVDQATPLQAVFRPGYDPVEFVGVDITGGLAEITLAGWGRDDCHYRHTVSYTADESPNVYEALSSLAQYVVQEGMNEDRKRLG